VDVVGGGLLYKFGTFYFSSLQTMDNYLRVINPAHRACIRIVRLFIYLTSKSPTVPTKILQLLSADSLPSLQRLRIILHVDGWGKRGTPGGRHGWVIDEELVEKFKRRNWEGLRGNLKEFNLVFSHIWVGNITQDENWIKDLEGEIKLRVLGSLAVKT
jgi:hypothetical protein